MSVERNEESFDAFFRTERARLVRQAYVLTGDLHGSQDLAQATLERVWRHWLEISDYERPAAWARRVLFNLALDQRKRSSREEPLGEHDQPSREHEDHLALVEALRRLPTTQQRALVLHDGVGLSVVEVASELDAPVGTVKAWLSRGRARVAEELTKKEPEARSR
jgi:RNA polymerase sigma-70 factor (ECF subfamily)